MARTKGVPTPRGNALNTKMDRSPSATSVTTQSRSSDSKEQAASDSPAGTPQPQAVKNAKSSAATRITEMKRTTSASSSQKRKSPPEDDAPVLATKPNTPKLALRSNRASNKPQNNANKPVPAPQSEKPPAKRQKVSEPIRRSARFSKTNTEPDITADDKSGADRAESKKSSKSTPKRTSARVGSRPSDNRTLVAESHDAQNNAENTLSARNTTSGSPKNAEQHQDALSNSTALDPMEVTTHSNQSLEAKKSSPEEPEALTSETFEPAAETSGNKVNPQVVVPTIEESTGGDSELQEDYLSDPSIPANLIYRLSREDAASIRQRDPVIDPAIQDNDANFVIPATYINGAITSKNSDAQLLVTSDQTYDSNTEQSVLLKEDQATSADTSASTKGQKVKGRPASTKAKIKTTINTTTTSTGTIDPGNNDNNNPDNDNDSPASANARSKNVANTYPRKQPFKAQVEYPGYPPNGSPIPDDYTLWDICQNMPNSLREETLLAFVQREWSANELCACLKDDVREILNARPGKDKTMVYQKRLERVKKDLIAKDEYQNLLANQQPGIREDGRPPWVKRGNVRRK